MTTYWLNGEKPNPGDTVNLPPDYQYHKPNTLNIADQGNQLSLTPFRQRRENSKPNSRRGSASFLPTQKSKDSSKFSENQPLLDNNSAQPVTNNGIPSKESNSSNHSLSNNIVAAAKILAANQAAINAQPAKTKETTTSPSVPNSNSKNNLKIGNNNWIPKLVCAEDIELGKKTNESSINCSSSVPLLARSHEANDSMV